MENVFSFMLGTVDGFLQNFVTNGLAAMMGPVGATFTAVGGMYFALYGWAVMFGYSGSTLVDVGRKAFVFFLVYAVATSGLLYGVLVTQLLWTLPESVASILLSVTGDSSTSDVRAAGSTANIETLVERYSTRVNRVTEQIADSGRVVPDVIAAVLALCMFIPLIAASFIVLISKVGLAIMIVLGPLVLLSTLFGWTKAVFEGWLRQTLTFILTAIFAYAVIAMLVAVLDSFAGELITASQGAAIAWTQGIPLALLAIVAAIVFVQVPQFAAGLVGGIGIGDLGASQLAARSGAARSKAAGARAGRALSRSSGALGSAIAPKLPPAVRTRLTQARSLAGRGAAGTRHFSGSRSAPSPRNS